MRHSGVRLSALALSAESGGPLLPKPGTEHNPGIVRYRPVTCSSVINGGGFGVHWLLRAGNNTHGHQSGDAVLKGLGRLLRERLRTGDSAGRYGGEEFLAVLPDTEAKACSRCWRTSAGHLPGRLRVPVPACTQEGDCSFASFPYIPWCV